LLTSLVKSRAVRVLAWTIAVAIPAFVALSRMYRGMHHPLDIAGGVFVGIAAVIVLVFGCRAAGAAAASRREQKQEGLVHVEVGSGGGSL
jgi:undecaprenyl-diphosphatase